MGTDSPLGGSGDDPEVSPGFVIRPFATIDDYRECVRLQEATWGEGFSERVSLAILKVSQRLGGVASGAYDEEGLAGFVFGMTGWEHGTAVHWSDMLAVRPELQNSGLGRTLKWHQRACLLEQGVETMYWTFDPLVSRNGHLNLNRLGAVVREYAVDMYGQTDSPLHRGIGTDRFIPTWEMAGQRVVACREAERRRRSGEAVHAPASHEPDAITVLGFDTVSGVPSPGPPVLDATDQAVAVSVPAEIGDVQKASLDLAVAWREATRFVFSHYLARGYEVRELVRGDPCSRYLMVRP